MARKRNYKKRRYPKRRSYGITSLNPASPLGQKYLWKTKYYSDPITINPTIGGVASTQRFSLNGLYDPDITNVGHQVLGFDQLVGTMYNHYTVLGAKIKVWATNISTEEIVVIMQIKDSSIASSDISDIVENGNCVWTTLAPNGQGGSTKCLATQVGMNRYFGRDVMGDQEQYSGNASGNPPEQVYAHILAAPNTTSDLSGIRINAEIEYTAWLTEPKQLAGS